MGTPPLTGGGYPSLSLILEGIDDRDLLAALEVPYTTGRPPYPEGSAKLFLRLRRP